MKKFRLLYIVLIAVIPNNSNADQIRVCNKSNKRLYAALYYHTNTSMQRIENAVTLHKGQKVSLERPMFALSYQRKLVASLYKKDLAAHLTQKQFDRLASINVSFLHGTQFYVNLFKGNVMIYDKIKWHFVEPLANKITQKWGKLNDVMFARWQQKFGDHIYKDTKAIVRTSSELNNHELAYIEQRLKKVKSYIEQKLCTHLTDSQVPRIALCFSGGGFRAMLFTLGVISALEQTSLINSLSYVSALSGSTWALAQLMQSGESATSILKNIENKLKNGLSKNQVFARDVSDLCLKKMAFNQSISAVDIFGQVLTYKLLGAQLAASSLDIQQTVMHERQLPYPLYTAAVVDHTYKSIEITPYEVGSDELGGYIPTWALGRKFEQGISQDFAPALPLSYFMGVWGSAFSATFGEIVDEIKHRISSDRIKNLLMSVANSPLGTIRFSASKVYNFTYGMPTCDFTRERFITLLDGGLHGKIPVQPLLKKERNIDMLIIIDMQECIKDSQGMHQAEKYAQERQSKFPRITYNGIEKENFQIFKDEHDSKTPTVVYIPCVKNESYSSFDPVEVIANEGYCTTNNFTYTGEQVQELSGLAFFTIKQYQEKLLEVIASVIRAKTNYDNL